MYFVQTKIISKLRIYPFIMKYGLVNSRIREDIIMGICSELFNKKLDDYRCKTGNSGKKITEIFQFEFTSLET